MTLGPQAPGSNQGTLTTTISFISSMPFDTLGQWVAPPVGLWSDYYIHNSYFTDGQKYMMPISSPGGFYSASVAFVQLASETLLWTCQWTATMQGAQPTVPDPDALSDPDWVFLDQLIEPAMVELLPDGQTYIYTINGVYWFGHQNPDQAQVAYPKAPWLLDSNPTARLLTDLSFIPGLIDASIGVPSSLPPSPGDVNKTISQGVARL